MSNARLARRKRRRGAVMLWMAVLLLVFLGLAALVIDMGYARLAQRQMQTAVNAAALEGMRYRDEAPSGETPASYRRKQAALFAQLASDDDLNLAANDTTVGAGIASNLVQGEGYQGTTIGSPTTDLEEDLAQRSTFIYRPNPQLNEDNEPHGDLVVGNYQGGTDHLENDDYSRADFTPATSGNAFLVRLRRAGVSASSLDDVPGVSSNGGGLPLLLGRGASFAADSPIRQLGTTVRATAIASAHRARIVGPPRGAMRGYTPFMIDAETWRNLPSSPTDASTPIPFAVGDTLEFIANPSSAIAYGNELASSDSGPTNVDPLAQYVPLVLRVNEDRFVCGFGWVENVQVLNGTITLTRRLGQVAPENVSTRLRSLPPPSIRTDLSEAQPPEDLALLAPVLVPSAR